MRVLVTGCLGFIGQNIMNYFVQQGIDAQGIDANDAWPDVNEFTHVIHLGAISSTTYRDVDRILTNNYDYSVKLLELCASQGTHFQYASSASVYGDLDHQFSESGPVSPQSPYAWSKYLFDRYVMNNLHRYHINVQGFRYFNVYGPHEQHKGDQASPYTKFINQAKTTGLIRLFTDSDQYLRDFVCVEDVCATHHDMMSINCSGIFNLGTGRAVSFSQVAVAIAREYSASIVEIPMPLNLRHQYQTYTCADLTKLRQHVDRTFVDILDYIQTHH